MMTRQEQFDQVFLSLKRVMLISMGALWLVYIQVLVLGPIAQG